MGDQRHAPAALPPAKRPGTHFTGGCFGPQARLEKWEKSRPHEIRYPEIDGWMDGWMDGWLDGWVDGWMDGRVGVWMDG